MQIQLSNGSTRAETLGELKELVDNAIEQYGECTYLISDGVLTGIEINISFEDPTGGPGSYPCANIYVEEL